MGLVTPLSIGCKFLRFLLNFFVLTTLTMLAALPASASMLSGAALQSKAAPPEASGIGIRLLDIPRATQDNPRARSYIVDHVRPGTTIERRIQVQNNTDSEKSVRVYPGAADIVNGSFIGRDGAAKNDLTTWTSAERTQLEMAPRSRADVLVTIDVPSNAAEYEQYAVLWAEVRTPKDPDTQIVSASRVGVRIYLSVGPGNGPPTEFTIDSLTAARTEDDKPTIVATVTNSGGRALDITGDVALSDGPGGLSAGPVVLDQATTIAPGESGEVSYTLKPELPNGPWTAHVKLRSGLFEQEETAKITFPDSGTSEPVSTGDGLSIPVVIAIILMLALIVGATATALLRKRKLARNQRQHLTDM